MTRPVGSVLLSALLLSPLPASAQAPAADEPRSVSTFRAGSTAVVVDAIVRDREGRPVTDLTLQDFELFEDGVRQPIGALTLVAPEAPWTDEKGRGVWHTGISAERAAAAGPDRTTSEGEVTVPGQTVLAIVFERLGVESMVPAREAALSYLQTPERPDDFVGVFVADLALETIQTFTNDRSRLREGIEAAAIRATGGSDYGRIGISVGAAPATIGAESRGPSWIWPGGMSLLPEDLSGLAEDIFRENTQLQQGYASIQGLRALTGALSVLPGRKTIVFFSQGLPLRSDEVRERFDAMIEAANRANVSVYPVDTVGLRVHSQDTMNGRALSQASVSDLETSIADPGSLAGGGVALRVSENVLRGGSTTHVFGRLAKETGGFVIENTNDIAGGFRRIDADRRFHYLLTYTPLNSDFKGEYRRIEVKVKRRGVSVRARSGYEAVHAPGTIPTLSYDAAPLSVLARTPLPQDVPATAHAIRLPQPDAPGRVALAVRVPANTLTYSVDEAAGTYRTDFTILARIRNQKGEVVRKGSQPYRLSGPSDEVDAARAGEVVFFRSPDLSPGTYTLEYVVHDALANRSGAGTLPLTIHPDTPNSLRVSDLLLIERAEQVAEADRDPKNPLMIGDILLYPRLGQVVEAGADVSISFYVGIRPDAGRPLPTAGLTLTRGGETVLEGPLSLVTADAAGQIHQLSRFTPGELTAGDYALTVTVTDGASIQHRSVRFQVK